MYLGHIFVILNIELSCRASTPINCLLSAHFSCQLTSDLLTVHFSRRVTSDLVMRI